MDNEDLYDNDHLIDSDKYNHQFQDVINNNQLLLSYDENDKRLKDDNQLLDTLIYQDTISFMITLLSKRIKY